MLRLVFLLWLWVKHNVVTYLIAREILMSKDPFHRKYLYRFTSLPFLLDTLSNKRLMLLDPKRWEDKNDSFYMGLYKEKSKKETFLALCFVQYKSDRQVAEKYNHWKIYSGNSSGVCIQFSKSELIKHFKTSLGDSFHYGDVRYFTINKLEDNYEKNRIHLNDLPFLKRSAFSDEREYRFIFESNENMESKPLSIPVNIISRITFNPWIRESVYKSICKVIRNISDYKNITIKRSTCLEYERWQKVAENISHIKTA